ncbi:MAG TPA: hypothetical protein VFY17_03390 [Pilimelia sp.]|nr:hypothetical protein [Pilimelia sp.]
MRDVGITRRRMLGAAAVVAGTTVCTSAVRAAPAAAAPARRAGISANGWPVLHRARSHPVEGSGEWVRLADGAAAAILTHVARRFHYEIDRLRSGDVQGFADSAPGPERYESNHLAGSAIAIRPAAYPAGVAGGLYPSQLVVVRDILAELDGAVAWGGHFRRPKESHFEIAHPPGHPTVTAAARRIQVGHGRPGGAGAVDAFDPARRAAAQAYARRAG